MKNILKSTLAVALLSSSAALAETTPCLTVAESAKQEITKAPENVLSLVSKLVAANETCAGEVVKAAIVSTSADKELVAQIVETAAAAAPKQLSQIVTYAMAVAPDAQPAIVAVLKKMDNGQGTAQGTDPKFSLDSKGGALPTDPKGGALGQKVSPLHFAGGEIAPFRGFDTETNEINTPSSPVSIPPVTE